MPALHDPKLEVFAQHYALNGHAIQAAREAGAHRAEGWPISQHPDVKKRVAELVGQRFAKERINAERVIHEVARGAFYDIRDLFDDEGNPLPPHMLADDVAAIVSQVKVELKSAGKGDDRSVSTVLTYKLIDKPSMLTLLAKHFKVIGDEADGVNAIANILADRLNSARARDLTHAEDAVYPAQDDAPLEGVRLTYTLPGETSSGNDLVAPPPEDPVPHQGAEDEERLW